MPIKKLFKKVSKVANKVADKIVPKEIAPLLPLAAPFIAPLLPAAAGAGLGSFLGSARFLVPQALAALGSAKTTGEINPISQGLAALSSYASMPKDFTPAEEAYRLANPSEFGTLAADTVEANVPFANTVKANIPVPGEVIPKGFDTSTLDLSFADRARSAVGSAGQQLKDAFDAPGIKGILTKGTLGGSAALSDQAIRQIQEFQAQQEADALAAEEATAAFNQNISDLQDLYAGFLNFPVAGLNMAEGGRVEMSLGGGITALLKAGAQAGKLAQRGIKPFGSKQTYKQNVKKVGMSETQDKMKKAFDIELYNINKVRGPRGNPEAELFDLYEDIASGTRYSMLPQATRNKMLRDIEDSMRNVGVDGGDYQNFMSYLKDEYGFSGAPKSAPGFMADNVIPFMKYKPNPKQKKAEGGIMNAAPGMPDGMQVDGRNGTFIPMGVKEKADDVPAMLSKNEFVMTADAVRGMGGGNVEVGAQRMYDLMNNLEARV